jgi:hypothetical protein
MERRAMERRAMESGKGGRWHDEGKAVATKRHRNKRSHLAKCYIKGSGGWILVGDPAGRALFSVYWTVWLATVR